MPKRNTSTDNTPQNSVTGSNLNSHQQLAAEVSDPVQCSKKSTTLLVLSITIAAVDRIQRKGSAWFCEGNLISRRNKDPILHLRSSQTISPNREF